MQLTARLKRIGRLTIAPIKGFFRWGPITRRSYPYSPTLWGHVKEVARQDFILYFEPFTNAVKEFKRERAKPY